MSTTPELNPQEVFKQNLKYISQTEIDVDTIERQFVRTDSRFCLTVGEIDCPTGEIIIADPLYYLYMGNFSPKLAIKIPVGKYPVQVAICRNEYVGIRMCTARLLIKDTRAVKYVCAEPTEESAAGKCIDGVLTGFPVDAGVMCFCDAQVAKEYANFIYHWHEANKDKNHYEDYFAEFFAESEKKLPAYQREGGDFIEWANPNTGNKMVMVSSGFGDGFYQSFWGYDADDEICELIVPLVNPDLFDFELSTEEGDTVMTNMTLQINAKLQPVDRHDLEDVLSEILEKEKLGAITGGGTCQMPTGEIKHCDIEFELNSGDKKAIERLAMILNAIGIAKGSKLYNEKIEIHVGSLEGMAIYLNGTDLDDEVYEKCDINFLAEQMEKLMGENGAIYGHWAGPEETALYFYGKSFEEMKNSTAKFISEYPLCEKARIVQIA